MTTTINRQAIKALTDEQLDEALQLLDLETRLVPQTQKPTSLPSRNYQTTQT
jgi:hypothetical protein